MSVFVRNSILQKMEDMSLHKASPSPTHHKKDGDSLIDRTHKSHRHRPSDDVQHQKRRHRRDETEAERNEKKRLKKEKRRSTNVRDSLKVVDDDDEEIWVEKGLEHAEVSLMGRILVIS